ncbi:hypothetical protein ADICYQ_5429 [Cyclobacterium qasimii M12-11B]|uniref:Lipid/polyisoprenoid-binding YceI-like domain-containing protein n=1 Tax=Cyclobacterium qasimii M12-11B TaxID=641524 RepID=S7WMS8_9BACT|nr:hypothetical protein ADICYQ_5429 [Cyclobacterium qasimii M12-11B]
MIIDQTEIIVKGKTSIGSFECSYESQTESDTLFFDNKSPDTTSLDFEIPVSAFGCGNFLLNSDFKRTLKAEEYPICLVSVNKLRRGSRKIYGDIYLQMAGKEIVLEKVVFHQLKEGLQGTLYLSTEELGLDASSRLGGLVKIEESIELEINLYLEAS